MGFTVWGTKDGNLAGGLLPVARGQLDLVLANLDAPRLDSRKLLRAIHEISPRIPVCFIAPRALSPRLMAQGAAVVLEKPLRIGKVVRRLAKLAAAFTLRGPLPAPNELSAGSSVWTRICDAIGILTT